MITPLSPYDPEEESKIKADIDEARAKGDGRQSEEELRCTIELRRNLVDSLQLMVETGQIEHVKYLQRLYLHPRYWIIEAENG